MNYGYVFQKMPVECIIAHVKNEFLKGPKFSFSKGCQPQLCGHTSPRNSVVQAMHGRVFSSTPGLHPPDASATLPPVVITEKVSKYYQMFPVAKMVPSWEPLNDTDKLIVFKI